MLVVITGVLLQQRRVERPRVGADEAAVNAVLTTFDATEQEASAAAETVISGLRRRQDTPGVRAAGALVKNLRVVDTAIRTLRDALQSDPGDLGLVRQLRREYHRKTALIRQTARLLDQLDSALPGTVT
jgi:hypothetical protein